MSFVELLKEKKNPEIPKSVSRETSLEEAKLKPEEILRKSGIKIRSVLPTSFGTEIIFAKKYNEKEIEDVLKDFDIKIKGKSVFIIK